MRIVVAGGTGFLGRRLCETLVSDGHEVLALSRHGPPARRPGSVWTATPAVHRAQWTGADDLTGWGHVVDGADVVVNLAGESIATRWTDAVKARLRDSRLLTTRALGRAIQVAVQPPHLLVNASAVGYYGSRGSTRLVELSDPGDDFLARLGIEWEAAAIAAGNERTRVIRLRTGVVLARDGGALATMMLPFHLFAGGPAGRGDQYVSWIHHADWVALVGWLLGQDHEGPFNATAPEPCTNAALASAIGRALRRPSWLPAPAIAVRLVLGEMADALVLGGQRVIPQRALELGFPFRFPTIDLALADIVGR
jgi:uncharacterized protein (TIGR01777 family)